MYGNNESRPYIPPLGLRLVDPVVRHDGDIAHIQVAAVNDEGKVVAHWSCSLKLPAMEGVLPGAPSCHLMEGGMGDLRAGLIRP